ncbi:hypothetical protein C8Q74DRAFT_1300977 [Fomes fomentarius]|nr:hypothetical protein C8Q74DRAFT_1300977 [Fomes fomentarius]
MSNNRWSLSRLLSSNSPVPSSSSHPSSQSHTYSHTQTHQQQQQQTHQSRQHPGVSPTQNAAPRTNGSQATNTNTASASSRSSSSRRTTRQEDRYAMTNLSSGAIQDSVWYTADFMLGAGMVIIQPSSGKVVLLHETVKDQHGRHLYSHWFLPKGRKDVGESLEQTALREAYEESGYRVSFLPVIMWHNAPEPPNSRDVQGLLPVTEPIFISTLVYGRGQGGRNKHGGEYLTFWYVGQIGEDAVTEANTRMADEVNYQTHLLTIDDALRQLSRNPLYQHIVRIAYTVWRNTMEWRAEPDYQRYCAALKEEQAKLTAGSQPDPDSDGPVMRNEQTSGAVPDTGETWEDVDNRDRRIPPGLAGVASRGTEAVLMTTPL